MNLKDNDEVVFLNYTNEKKVVPFNSNFDFF